MAPFLINFSRYSPSSRPDKLLLHVSTAEGEHETDQVATET